MSDSAALSSAPPPARFDLDFNAYVSGDYNRDLGGKGTLVVHPAEPCFVFSGRPRRALLLGREPVELAFRSDEIWNVSRHAAGVAFNTARGKSGAKREPFVFTAASEAEAATIAALLPATQDEDFRAAAAFGDRLRALPAGGGGFGSITTILIVLNVAAFIAMGFAGAGWFETASIRPYIRFGANNTSATVQQNEWWRLVTSLFLHYGIVHLLLNLWALLQVGHLVERLAGRVNFTVVYFGSGVLGGLASLHWHTQRVWSAGASGAVFGVYGALLGYLLRERDAVPRGVFQPILRSTLLFAGYNLLFGAVHPHIDNAAHVGGFVAGAALGWLSALPLEPLARARLRRPRLLAALAGTAAAIALGVVTLRAAR